MYKFKASNCPKMQSMYKIFVVYQWKTDKTNSANKAFLKDFILIDEAIKWYSNKSIKWQSHWVTKQCSAKAIKW